MTRRLVAITILTLGTTFAACGGSSGSSNNGPTQSSADALVKNAVRTTIAGAEATRDNRDWSAAESSFNAQGGCLKGYDAWVDSMQKKQFLCISPTTGREAMDRQPDKSGKCASDRTMYYRYTTEKRVDMKQPGCFTTDPLMYKSGKSG